MDALGEFFLMTVAAVTLLGAVGTISYVAAHEDDGDLSGFQVQLYFSFFGLFAALMLAALETSNLGLLFVLVEASTLAPQILRLSFLLAVVGYGTKVGLPPMHTWLPDAHAQAPAPASAMLSAALLNTGMYAIIRFLAIEPGWLGAIYPRAVLLSFGFASIVTGALFMVRRELQAATRPCRPKVVATCVRWAACTQDPFVHSLVSEILPVDVWIPGCQSNPLARSHASVWRWEGSPRRHLAHARRRRGPPGGDT